MPGSKWHLDHLVPLVAGGQTRPENLWPAHGQCNMRAGGKLGRARVKARKMQDKGIREW